MHFSFFFFFKNDNLLGFNVIYECINNTLVKVRTLEIFYLITFIFSSAQSASMQNSQWELNKYKSMVMIITVLRYTYTG